MKKTLLLFLLLPFMGFSQVIPAGDYIISSAYATDAYPNFKNLTTAVTYLNSHGIGGNVRFLLDNDQTVTSQITINAFSNTTNSTVTIKPNTGKSVKITANMPNDYTGVPAVFKLNGAKNIIIDGSNSSLQTKNLELINNDDLGYIYRSIIWIASNSAIPSSNITVKNITLKFTNRTSQNNLLAAVYSGNNTIGGNNTISMSASTASNSNIIIKNNEFVNVKEGVHINGDSDASKRPINWSIQNNKILGGTEPVDKLNRAIYVSNSTNFTISNNIISGVLRYSNATVQETAGISIVGESSGTIDGNIIDDVANINNAGGSFTGGIFINTNTGVTITVSNNMISNVYTGAADSNDWNYHYKGYGIYVKSGGTTNLYFNTVVLNRPTAGGLTAGLYLEGGASFNISNNIFYNSQPGTQYGIFANVGVVNINNISNNAYYVTNASGNFSNRLGSNSYLDRTGFINWKTAVGNKDAESIIQLPTFVSSTDLHLQDIAANAALKAGTPNTGITTDIDGHGRSATKPYMGADEIVVSCVTPAVGVLPAQTICYDSRPNNLTLTGETDNVTVIEWESCSDIAFNTGVKSYPITSHTLETKDMEDLQQNTYFRAVVSLSGCIAYSTPVLITVNSQEPAPTIGTVTQPTCTTTGSVELTGLPSSGSIFWTKEDDSSGFSQLNGTEKQTINLEPGTYQFKIISGSTEQCSTKLTEPIVITAPVVKTWNGSTDNDWNTETNWTPNGIPTASNCVVIPVTSRNPIISGTNGTFYANTLTINDEASLVVDSTNTLKVEDKITIDNLPGKTASLTFENNASLVQINDVQNEGEIIYKRTSAAMKNFDYTYWSSPVAGQKAKSLSPNTFPDKYSKWTNGWVFYNGEMMPGVGYIIRVPKPGSAAPDNWSGTSYEQKVEFKGIPNNGNIDGETVVEGQNFLIGNPYPSALKADDFIDANKDRIDGALYFWTHNTAIKPNGSGGYSYTSDDYAVYNRVGGVATFPAPSGTKDGANKAAPSGFIAAGQSFFAKALATVNIEDKKIKFTNAMRVVANNAQFFRTAHSKGELSKSRIWLNLSNDNGAFKQILVGYLDGATDDYESQYDAKSLNGNSFVNFYSVLNDAKFSIQGRALPFSNSDAIPLGYVSSVTGDFSIEIDETDGELADKAIYLEDKVKGVTYDLRKGAYTFNTEKGTFNDRFILKYTNSTLGVDDFENKMQLLMVSVKNKTISIDAKSETLSKVVIYDVAGRTIYNNHKINTSVLEVSNLGIVNQVLLVKVVLESGFIETRKVIIN